MFHNKGIIISAYLHLRVNPLALDTLLFQLVLWYLVVLEDLFPLALFGEKVQDLGHLGPHENLGYKKKSCKCGDGWEEHFCHSVKKKILQHLGVQCFLWDQKVLAHPLGRRHRGHPSYHVLLLFLKHFSFIFVLKIGTQISVSNSCLSFSLILSLFDKCLIASNCFYYKPFLTICSTLTFLSKHSIWSSQSK